MKVKKKENVEVTAMKTVEKKVIELNMSEKIKKKVVKVIMKKKNMTVKNHTEIIEEKVMIKTEKVVIIKTEKVVTEEEEEKKERIKNLNMIGIEKTLQLTLLLLKNQPKLRSLNNLLRINLNQN